MRPTALRRLAVLLSLLCLPVSGLAQGTGVQFLNFEAPAHKPIAVVRVGQADYLLVANVPDNSVEVYDTVNHRFLLRVPTGQRPVTIAVRPSLTGSGGRQVYVANWLGDSVTVFDLEPTGVVAAPLRFRLVTTEPVGDEPVGIAFLPEDPNDPNTMPGGPFHELVFVTSSARATWGIFVPGTMAPVLTGLELMHSGAAPPVNVAVRDPRAIAFAPPTPNNPTQLWVLNFRGGNDPAVYDLDLWGAANIANVAATGFADLPRHGGLGTTNFQMAFAANRDLYVVGIRARNKDPQLVPNVRDAAGEPIHQAMVTNETGFAVSFLARYRNLGNPASVPEVLDLNDANQGAPPIQQAALPVTQPTDLVVHGDGTAGRTRIFVTGFNSDTLAVVTPTNTGVANWTVTRVDVKAAANAFSAANLGGVMRGPRGLALKAGPLPAAGDRLYVYNRLDSSVTIVDPNANPPAVLGNFGLRGQVEPIHVTSGRKFLYSSKLSGGGNVSCATCHIDGNTDFLAWNLADGNPIPAPGDPNQLPGALGPNQAFKGQMVTQPLRGLVNFEVPGRVTQDTFFSNRPYHWRGDKGFLEQFNAAFVNLMGMTNIVVAPPTPAHHKGIPDTEMTLYRDFVFSIHYPPNPEQPWQRTYSGSFFDPASPPATPTDEVAQLNDHTVGSGGRLGLKAFHVLPSDPVSLACVHCHLLPEGSNNRLTEAIANSDSTFLGPQGLETAQLKALVLKEKRLLRVSGGGFVQLPAGGPTAVTHEFGLTHTGLSDGIPGFGSLSINDFVAGFQLQAAHPALPDAVSLYLRELDTGVGPLVGFTASTDPARFNADPLGQAAALTAFEGQVRRANAGLAVHARVNGVMRGFWLDVTDPATPYHEEPQTGLPTIGPFTQAGLLDVVRLGSPLFAPDNLLTFHATPLGSARRVARIEGGLAPRLAGGAPTNVTLLPARPMTANAEVPRMTVNWTDMINSFTFLVPPNDVTVPHQVAVTHYQKSLVNHAPGGFGLAQLRHEVPRRLRVAGTGIRDNAFLVLWAPNGNDIATATAASPPTTVPTPAANPVVFILPIHPTDDGTGPAWETAAELEPLFLLGLLNGGPFNAPATQAFLDPLNLVWFSAPPPIFYTLDTTDVMQPALWNWYFVQVANDTPGGFALSAGSWQRLTIQ